MSSVADAAPKLTRFRVLSLLGGGGQGAVWEAFDLERQTRVALKMLGTPRPEQVLRFKNEFRAARDLNHPNLVRLGELVEENGQWFFTMELVRGQDFLTWIRHGIAGEGKPLSSTETDTVQMRPPERPEMPTTPSAGPATSGGFDEARLRRALGDLGRAVAFFHRAGKVHRDLKPSNVIITDEGRLVLIDFGVVAELTDQDADTGLVIGTTLYMAPEQARGEIVGAAADWYAVGVMLFEVLTGRRPFAGSPADVIDFKCNFDAPPPSMFVTGLPPDLEQLCQRLLSRDAAQRPSDAEALDALGEDSDAPSRDAEGSTRRALLVGRDRELAELESGYASMRLGRAVAVFLEGESGIGKTTLASHFVERLRDGERNLLVLRGRCHEQERVSYNAFDAIIDGVVRHLQTRGITPPPEGLGPLVKLFPALRAVAPADVATASGGPSAVRGERAEAFAALRELFRRLARRRPVVALIDDVQWADADSLALFEELTRQPNAPPLLFVCTARPDPNGGPPPALLRARCDVQRLPLLPLSADDAHRLARAALAQQGIDGDDAAAIADDAHGHPMFIDELVRHRARHPGSSTTGLDEALTARIAELSEPAQRIVGLVAAAGTPVAQRAVADAAALPADVYADEVAELRARKLVRISGGRRDDIIEPYHDRVQKAAYRRMGDDEKRELHRRLADALTALGAGPEILFIHRKAAGQVERALPHAVAAARAASASLAFGRAVELWKSALALESSSGGERDLRIALGDALQNDGRAIAAADEFLRAAELAPGDGDLQLELRRRAVEQLLMGGDLERGWRVAQPLLDIVGVRVPSGKLGTLARLGWNSVRLRRRRLTWQRRAASELPARSLQRLDVCWSLGAGLSMVDLARSAMFSTRGALDSLDVGEPLRICRALVSASFGTGAMGRRAQAAALVAAAERAAEEHGSDLARFYALLARSAFLYIVDTDFAAMLDNQPELERLWRSAGRGPGWETDVIEHFCCAALFFVGRFFEGAERVRTRIREAQDTGNRFSELTFRLRFYHGHVLADRPDEARREVEAALAAWPASDDFGNQKLWALSSLCHLAMYIGDVEAQAPHLDDMFARCERSLIGRLPTFRLQWWFDAAAWWTARALYARRAGDERGAQRHLARAHDLARRLATLDMPLAPVTGQIALATAAHAAGDDVTAARIFGDIGAEVTRRFASLAPMVQRRLGQAMGSDAGRALVDEADATLRSWGAVDPARVTDALLPW